jgi:hypothetical protein
MGSILYINFPQLINYNSFDSFSSVFHEILLFCFHPMHITLLINPRFLEKTFIYNKVKMLLGVYIFVKYTII